MKYLSIFFSLAFFISKSDAQKRTVITGDVPRSYKNVNITLEKIINILNGEDTLLKINNGKFNFVCNIKEPAYFSFFSGSANLQYLLLEPGDSLVISIDSSGKVQWNGRGFEKNIYQTEAGKKFQNQFNYSDDSPLSKDANLYFHFLDSCRIARVSFLKTQQHLISKLSYSILLASIWGETNDDKAKRILRMSWWGNAEDKDNANKLYAQWRLLDSNRYKENDTAAYSLEYMNYRNQVNELDFWELYNINGADWDLANKYFLAKSLSDGKVQERLLARILLNRMRAAPDEKIQSLINDYISFAKNNDIKNKIKNEWAFQQCFGSGRPAINFALPDTNNKQITLKQFKGKIVILDFWFKGCPGCASVFNAMRDVKRTFENNKDVVFLNISIDERKEDWLKGIEQYHLNKDLNVYTEGYGEKHHTIKDYGVNGYPKQFVIDKNGNFITSNPPRADDDNGKGMINIIQQALKNKNK